MESNDTDNKLKNISDGSYEMSWHKLLTTTV